MTDPVTLSAAERQESCVMKLNQFLQPGNWIYPLVVCSRIKEYQLCPTQLALNTSVELQPFTTEQIQNYLKRTGNNQLGDSIRDDPALRKLAKTPLFLKIIVLSYQKLSLNKWQELKSTEERFDYLFSTYVEVMLGRKYKGKRPSDEKNKHWLGWLALKLIEQNETEFFIEKMQPTLLDTRRQETIYQLGVWLIVGLSFGVSFGLLFRQSFGLSFGLVSWLFFGLSGGIRTSETLQVNWKKFWRVGLQNGGNACIQHFNLRLILYRHGHIPWNYTRFLDYATDRLFLQRVGGGYRFMHDLLRQHFADNYRQRCGMKPLPSSENATGG